jgi:hypothetical protein
MLYRLFCRHYNDAEPLPQKFALPAGDEVLLAVRELAGHAHLFDHDALHAPQSGSAQSAIQLLNGGAIFGEIVETAPWPS